MMTIRILSLFLQLFCGGAIVFAFTSSCPSRKLQVQSQQHERRVQQRRQQQQQPFSSVDGHIKKNSLIEGQNRETTATTTRLFQYDGWPQQTGGTEPVTQTTDASSGEQQHEFPTLVKGIYQVKTPEQHRALLEANHDKLIVMKFTAAYCRACASLNPRFEMVVNDPEYANMPVVWADFAASPYTKDYFRRLGVLSLPTVHFYDGPNGLVENFPCGKSKIRVLKMKLQLFQIKRVDAATGRLKLEASSSAISNTEDAPRVVRELRIGDELVTPEHLNYLRHDLPFLKDLTDAEFDRLLSQTTIQTFNPGDIIIRQGLPGRTFFVIKSGRCEMLIRSRFNDPISTPPSYLGAVVNELTKFDYFGERALSTSEPYAASIRVLEKTRCFAFDADIIPESSILSKQRRASRELTAQLTERYNLPADYEPQVFSTEKDETILELLVRFKQIRQAAKCFEYVTTTEPFWGDQSGFARRSLLVSKLSKSQQEEFKEVFNLIDVYGRGKISLLEMRKFMASAREQKTDEELMSMIGMITPASDTVNPQDYGSIAITLDEFLGVMAEAEFYSLFTETFQALDTENIGYVRAGDLDQVLGGVRDLISDDRKSLIDVEDKDVQIDYEQFSKMLIGAAL